MTDQTFQKPKAKPRGAPQNVREKMARLDILTHKAVRVWEKILDDKSDATNSEKIQVSKLVVEYAWGKPKQQVQVDAKVEVNHRAHIEALHMLASAASGPVIDANPLIAIDNQTPVAKSPLLPSPDQQGRVELDPLAALGVPGLDLGELAAPFLSPADDDDPPPGASGTPTGGVHMRAPRPLDIKNDE